LKTAKNNSWVKELPKKSNFLLDFFIFMLKSVARLQQKDEK